MAPWLIIGLGNPGREYARTRHNVGAEAVEELCTRQRATLRPGRDPAQVADLHFGDQAAVAAVPATYMNESGRAVRALVKRYGTTDPARIVVVHDELDLPPGQVRVKAGGGLAGHNGLRSITAHLHTQDYLRVRIGVGKPPHKDRGAEHVLTRLPPAERALLDLAITEAVEAVTLICTEGVAAAMQVHNRST